ncbi:MAG: SMC-Scp complex subunit ScpB [Desulfobacteraceae bacterium]|nr:SMC-Scp complex subunit ScpB [Desulfobacteraceae bacterium]MBC2755324.1 SMC-Scp complex subunit ScpB [Desulfobacteraceae bacterium]
MEDIKNIVESLLFVAETPLSVEHFKNAIPEAETDQIKQTILALKEEYELKNGGFLIHEVAGGFQFRTRPEYKEWIRRLLQPKPPKLSKPAMETLAIIAYRQPILRSEVEHIRGVNSGNSIRILLERKLIRVLGRREVPGRPLVYATTKKFLETFDLKDLKDLPSLKEIDELESKSGKPRQQEIVFGDANNTDREDDIENNADNKNSEKFINDVDDNDVNVDNNT